MQELKKNTTGGFKQPNPQASHKNSSQFSF